MNASEILGLSTVEQEWHDARVDVIKENNVRIKEIETENEIIKDDLKREARIRTLRTILEKRIKPESLDIKGDSATGKLIVSRSRSKLTPRVTSILDGLAIPYEDETQIVLNPALTEEELRKVAKACEALGIQVFTIKPGGKKATDGTIEAFAKVARQEHEQLLGDLFTFSVKV